MLGQSLLQGRRACASTRLRYCSSASGGSEASSMWANRRAWIVCRGPTATRSSAPLSMRTCNRSIASVHFFSARLLRTSANACATARDSPERIMPPGGSSASNGLARIATNRETPSRTWVISFPLGAHGRLPSEDQQNRWDYTSPSNRSPAKAFAPRRFNPDYARMQRRLKTARSAGFSPFYRHPDLKNGLKPALRRPVHNPG